MPDHSPHEEICKKCGSKYWVTSQHVLMRDNDSISCEVCGEPLIAWNEARIFDAKLAKRAEWTPKT